MIATSTIGISHAVTEMMVTQRWQMPKEFAADAASLQDTSAQPFMDALKHHAALTYVKESTIAATTGYLVWNVAVQGVSSQLLLAEDSLDEMPHLTQRGRT